MSSDYHVYVRSIFLSALVSLVVLALLLIPAVVVAEAVVFPALSVVQVH